MLRKCGEERGRFYDRRGDFFREGVDPRNHYGRFVHHFDQRHLKVDPEVTDMMDDIQRQMDKLVAHQLGVTDG